VGGEIFWHAEKVPHIWGVQAVLKMRSQAVRRRQQSKGEKS